MIINVLIVEDEDALSALIGLVLNKHIDTDLHISMVKNGYGAVEFLQNRPVDVLISDNDLDPSPSGNGKRDGEKLIDWTIRNNPEVKIIHMSGKSANFDLLKEKARELGYPFIEKPFEIPEFLEIFKNILEALTPQLTPPVV